MRQELKQSILAGILLMAAILSVNYYFYVRESKQELVRLRAELSRVEKQKAKFLSLLRNKRRLLEQKRQLEEEIERLKVYLPKTEDLPGLIRAIANLASLSGVEVSRVELGREISHPDKHYAAINIKISFSSNYEELMNFLKKVDALDRLVCPYSLDVVAKGISEDPKLQVSGLLQTYRYIETVKKPKKRRKR